MLQKNVLMVILMSAVCAISYSAPSVLGSTLKMMPDLDSFPAKDTAWEAFKHVASSPQERIERNTYKMRRSLEQHEQELQNVLNKITLQQEASNALVQELALQQQRQNALLASATQQQRIIDNLSHSILGGMIASGGMMLYEKYKSRKNATPKDAPRNDTAKDTQNSPVAKDIQGS